MSNDAVAAMKAAVVFIKIHHFKGGLAEDVVTALDAAIKAQEAGTIPDGVYYDVLSINFYAYSGSGMGAEFYAKWFHRRFEFPTSAQPSPEPQITYESSMSPMFNGIPLRHAGAQPWAVFPSSADDEATRWRHGESLSEPPEPPWSTPPFANCSFNICDLRGQCMKEGRCHHPKDEPPSEPQGDGFGIDCSPELSRAVFAEFTVSPHPAAQISDERIERIYKSMLTQDDSGEWDHLHFAHLILKEIGVDE